MKAEPYLSKLLVRWTHEGFKGASATDTIATLDGDGNLIAETPMHPRAITREELGELLEDKMVDIIDSANCALAERDRHEMEAGKAKAAQTAAEEERDTLTDQLAEARARGDEALRRLTVATDRINQMAQALAEANAENEQLRNAQATAGEPK